METLNIRTNDPKTGRPATKKLLYNDAQLRVWRQVAEKIDRLEPIRLIILKARRLGMSTAVQSWMMAMIAAGDQVNALITAHKKEPAHEIWEMSKFFVTSSPLLSRVARVEKSKITIGRSQFRVATAGTPESQRGVDLTAWLASEAASYIHPEVMPATMQCLPQSDDVFSIGVIESTAKGMVGDGQMFYEEWVRASEGDSDWLPIFLPWHIFPEYRIRKARIEQPTAEEYALRERFELSDEQLAWRRWVLKNKCGGDIDMLHQEYPACLLPHVRISTERGIMPIGEALGARQTESGLIVAWGPQPISRVVRMETVGGRWLEGTPDHPVRLADGGWRGLGDLVVGDRIRLRPPRFAESVAVVRWSRLPGMESRVVLSEEWATLLGYFMGDGCWYKTQFSIAADGQDIDVHEDIRRVVEACLGRFTEKEVGRVKGRRGCRYIMATGRDDDGRSAALSVLRHLGVLQPSGAHSWIRRVGVPVAIWQSPQPMVRAFLRALFECDGSITGGVVRFYTKSRPFAQELQLLLLGFEIPVDLAQVTKQAGNGSVYEGTEVRFRRLASERFMKEIGFVGARKRLKWRPTSERGKAGREFVPLAMEDIVAGVTPLPDAATFDVTVAPDHIFSANGIETHNTAEEAFIQAGLPFFHLEDLMPLDKMLRKGKTGSVSVDGEFQAASKGPVEVFQFPEPGHTYCIGADSSMGLNDDKKGRARSRSAAEVIDMETQEQVAEYDAPSDPHVFAAHLAGLGRMYHNALLAPEIQASGGGGGREVLVFLRDPDGPGKGYWNIHRWVRNDDRLRRTDAIVIGWETNSRTRPRMLSRIRQAVKERAAPIHSRKLYEQLSAFGENDAGRTEALSGHDDLLFAWGIALMSRSENYYRMPPTPTVESPHVNWEAMGIHVLHPEAVQDRLKRLMAMGEPEARSFLQM